MANEKENVRLYFQKKKEISIGELFTNQKYQNAFIEYVAPNLLKDDVQQRLIEVIALMDFKDQSLYELINKIYARHVEVEGQDVLSKSKNNFINKLTSYVKKNTGIKDDHIMEMITKMFEALTMTFSYKHSNNDDEKMFFDDEFNYLSNQSVSAKKENVLSNKIEPQNTVKIKNLNPTKVAKYCILHGIPENIDEVIENIKHNRSFPIALMTSMANIASIMEFKNEMSSKTRENYLKIFKFIDEKDINIGIKKLIDNFKKMTISDRLIIRFFHIWQDVIANYTNMTDYQKNQIMNVFILSTSENFKQFKKEKEDYNTGKVKNIENTEKQKQLENSQIDILNVKIDDPETSRRVKNIALAFVENQNITEKVISVMSGSVDQKWLFVRTLIEAVSQNLQSENSKDIDNTIEYNLKTLHKIILEFTIEDYENSFYCFLKYYYQISGRFVTYRIKTINNRVLMEILKLKYGAEAPEIRIYASSTVKIIVNKKYID